MVRIKGDDREGRGEKRERIRSKEGGNGEFTVAFRFATPRCS